VTAPGKYAPERMHRPGNATALVLLALAGSCSSGGGVAGKEELEPGWVALFDGESLDGWTVKIRGHEPGDDFTDTFRVEDGVLKVVYDGYEEFEDRFGHLFFDGEFSHYRLRVEYRFTGDQVPGGPEWAYRNSGVMIHGQSPESMGLDQDFPVSIEVQLLGGNGSDPRPTANLCTPGTHVVMDGELVERHCTDSSSKTHHGDQWVTVEVEVRGNERIEHFVDGVSVLRYSQPQLNDGTPLVSGTISLQSESHPVEFRRVELLEYPAD